MRPSTPLKLGLIAILVAACSPLEPDPVIKDGIDLGPIQSFEAERAQITSGMGNQWDSSASDNHYLALYSNVTATVPLELLNEVSGFVVRARGDQCEGGPELEMSVDGAVRLTVEVKATHWTDYPALAHLTPGMHKFAFRFTNDKYVGPKCDRNLFIDKVTFINTRSVPKGTLPAITLLAPAGTHIADDARVPGGKALAFMSEASATGQMITDTAAGLSIHARGDQCHGAPELTLTVDGVDRGWFPVSLSQWADYTAPVALAPGEHTLSLAFINDKVEGGCDRNVYVSEVTALTTAPPAVPLAPPPPAPPTTDGGAAGPAGKASDAGAPPAPPPSAPSPHAGPPPSAAHGR